MDTTNLGDVFKLERKLDAALQGPSRLVDVAALHGQNPFTGLSALQGPNSFADLSALQSPSPLAGLSAASSAYISAVGAFDRLNVSGMVEDLWAASNPAAGIIQNLGSAGYLQGINAVTPYWPLSQYMSTLNIAKTVIDPSWKQVLMRQSWMPEAGFVSRLAEVERSSYFALRPELNSVVQQMSAQYEGAMQNVVVRWLGTTEMDFEFDFDVEDAPTDGTFVAVPAKPRRILTPRTPIDGIDTTSPRASRPLIRRELAIQLANDPRVRTVVIVGGPTASGGISEGSVQGLVGGALTGLVMLFIDRYQRS